MNIIETHNLYSPQLLRDRTIRVWLPKGYKRSKKRYPVLYMHDGQNLFEPETAAFRDWKIPLRMESLPESHQVIIVGIDNGEERRIDEYAPYPKGTQGGGEGDLYMEFIIETIKEFVDYSYRTFPFREATAIAGSSLGGLISMYAGLKYGEYFSKIGILSPALWYNPQVMKLAENAQWKDQYYYIAGSKLESSMMPMSIQNAYWGLKNNGYDDRKIYHAIRDKGRHNELFWSKEFTYMMQWFYGE